MRMGELSLLSRLAFSAAGCLTLAANGTTQGLSLSSSSSASSTTSGDSGSNQRWPAEDGNPPAGETAVEYVDGKAIIPWSELEGSSASGQRSYLYEACQQLNPLWGSEITCRVVRPSFQRFYVSIAREKAMVREVAGNAGDISSRFLSAVGCLDDRSSPGGGVMSTFGTRNERTTNDFLSKVKTVTIKYIDGQDLAEKNDRISPLP